MRSENPKDSTQAEEVAEVHLAEEEEALNQEQPGSLGMVELGSPLSYRVSAADTTVPFLENGRDAVACYFRKRGQAGVRSTYSERETWGFL